MKKTSATTANAKPALLELYGSPISGPIPQGVIDWKTVAVYTGGACLVAGVFAYCIHKSNQKNAEIWTLQAKKTNDVKHSVEVELNVVGAIPQNLPLPEIQQTASTRVIVTATGNAMQLFGSTAPAIPPAPGQPLLDVAITTVSFSPEEFATATGLGTIGEFLNVRLVGIGPGHIKIRFTNLAD